MNIDDILKTTLRHWLDIWFKYSTAIVLWSVVPIKTNWSLEGLTFLLCLKDKTDKISTDKVPGRYRQHKQF